MSSTETLSIDFPRRGRGELSPPVQYAGLREQPGLVRSNLPNGSAVWLVSRYEDVRAVLTDKRISSNSANPGFPSVGSNGTVPSTEEVPGWFVALDSPDHDRFRKALIPEFTVRRIRNMRPAIQQIVDGLIDKMLAKDGKTDLVSDFALPVPSLVICTLLGVPYEDHDFFESQTRIMVTITSTDEEREKATKAILRYVSRLLKIKKKMPGDDLLSRLVANNVLTTEELSGVALLLLIAGHETTANSIGLGVVTLLLNQKWIGDPRVVEEVLRYLSVADLVTLRVAVEDVEIGGQLIKAGEGIVPLGAAANHDSCAFADAGEFNPERPARHHVAFGYGIHQCLGQNLVRAELEIAFQTLFERVPTLQIDQPIEDLPFKYDGILFGLHALPVRW